MQFLGVRSSVAFQFIYKSYVINIADYYHSACVEGTIIPDGKISVMISKHGKALSKATMKKISFYINLRITGFTLPSEGILHMSLEPHDQFMQTLMNALNVIVPE